MFQTVTYPNNTTHTQNNQNNNMIIEEQQQEEPKKYKSIIELQKEINFYKNKERLYKMLLTLCPRLIQGSLHLNMDM